MSLSSSQCVTTTHNITCLYQQNHQWLLNWLCKKVGCSEQAADVAQDTFLRLLMQAGLSEIEKPRALLTTTATRLLIDASRKKQVEQTYLAHYYYYHGEQGETLSEEALAIISESLYAVISVLEALPQKCQHAFLLNRLEGKRYKEIASELSVSVSMVKKYIAQALLHCHLTLSLD